MVARGVLLRLDQIGLRHFDIGVRLHQIGLAGADIGRRLCALRPGPVHCDLLGPVIEHDEDLAFGYVISSDS